MIIKCCFLINLSLISCVVGTINDNYFNKAETESKLADLEGNVNQTLNRLESNILDKLIRYINRKTDAINKTIPELEEKMTQRLNASNNKIEEKFEEKMTETLNAAIKKIEEKLEEQNTQIMNALGKIKKDLYKPQLPCKVESFGGSFETPSYSIDNETLKHATVKRDSTGNLTNFEMHIAIKAGQYVDMRLWDKQYYSESDIRFYIYFGLENNQYVKLGVNGDFVQRISTPDILSSTQFRAFYIKIADENLTVGKEGDSSPLINFNDSRLRSVNYFSLYKDGSIAEILYDCPAPV